MKGRRRTRANRGLRLDLDSDLDSDLGSSNKCLVIPGVSVGVSVPGGWVYFAIPSVFCCFSVSTSLDKNRLCLELPGSSYRA